MAQHFMAQRQQRTAQDILQEWQGAAPAQQFGPPTPQYNAPGYYGGSPETNSNLRPIDQPLSPAAPSASPEGAILLQRIISALGGVTNGGPLSPIGNLSPGKFGGY
jgi:hypothetical protein